MMRLNSNLFKIPVRYASSSGGGYPGSMRTALPRRPVRKIPVGKARPAIYYQFDVAVELTDGSVVMRRSQYPQDEIRLIQDQRNNPFWNPSRDDLVDVDPNSVGNIEKFKQRYSGMFGDTQNSSELSSKGKKVEKKATSKSEDVKSKEATNAKESASKSKGQVSSELDDFLDFLDETESSSIKKK